MKKLALLFLVAVVSFGFVGCVSSPQGEPYVPPIMPAFIGATVVELEYQAADIEKPELTKVVLEFAGLCSQQIVFHGDYRRSFSIGTIHGASFVYSADIESDGKIQRVDAYELFVGGARYMLLFKSDIGGK